MRRPPQHLQVLPRQLLQQVQLPASQPQLHLVCRRLLLGSHQLQQGLAALQQRPPHQLAHRCLVALVPPVALARHSGLLQHLPLPLVREQLQPPHLALHLQRPSLGRQHQRLGRQRQPLGHQHLHQPLAAQRRLPLAAAAAAAPLQLQLLLQLAVPLAGQHHQALHLGRLHSARLQAPPQLLRPRLLPPQLQSLVACLQDWALGSSDLQLPAMLLPQSLLLGPQLLLQRVLLLCQ